MPKIDVTKATVMALSGICNSTKGPRPGFEPGSEDPQSSILTTRLPQTLCLLHKRPHVHPKTHIALCANTNYNIKQFLETCFPKDNSVFSNFNNNESLSLKSFRVNLRLFLSKPKESRISKGRTSLDLESKDITY